MDRAELGKRCKEKDFYRCVREKRKVKVSIAHQTSKTDKLQTRLR